MGKLRRVLGAATLAVSAVACTSSSATHGSNSATLNLGYQPNITHAAAIIGVTTGAFQRSLGSSIRLRASSFNAGPDEVQALFSGALDAAYLGPSPAINAFVRSRGEAIRIVAGATTGGAFLIVRPDINAAADLKGRTIATPQRGNTQDVALRTWLAGQHLHQTLEGGGDVHVISQDNAQTLDAFKAGHIDGAWLPEPWASRLIIEGGGHALVDEASLWPAGKYATTVLAVRTAFLKDHPDIATSLLRGHVAVTKDLSKAPDKGKTIVGDALASLTGKRLKRAVLDRAWRSLRFTVDPIGSSLQVLANRAAALGFTKSASLRGILDLRLLNEILTGSGAQPVNGAIAA